MAKTNQTGLVIYIGLALIVGIILAGVIGDYSYDATTLSTRVNETVTTASATATLANDDVEGISAFANGSNDLTWLISTIGFNWTDEGVITVNDTVSDSEYNVSYTFQGDAYVDESTSRVLIDLIPLFFVIAILGIAIYMGIKQLRENGWL